MLALLSRARSAKLSASWCLLFQASKLPSRAEKDLRDHYEPVMWGWGIEKEVRERHELFRLNYLNRCS